MTQFLSSRLLVTGASGQLGRLAAGALLDVGAASLAVASRKPDALGDLAARGATPVRIDFDDAASLDAAFHGIERVLIVSTDALGVPGLRQRQHLAAVAAAARAGVGHIVYTSMPNPEPGSPVPFAPDHHETERALAASGVPHTILRVNWYMQNLLHSLPHILASGRWFSAAGEGKAGYVAREDVGATAAAALAGATGTERLDVTGPEALSVREVAALAVRAIGRPIEVVDVDEAALAAGIRATGMPGPVADLFAALDTNTRMGRVDIVTNTVQRLTGRAPRRMEAFLAGQKAGLLAAA